LVDAFTVPEETAVARQWQSKHVSMEANIPATIEEPREAVFSLGSVPRLYNEEHEGQPTYFGAVSKQRLVETIAD
jgi:hypothetical protein